MSNNDDMADMKFICHRGLPFSCDNCTVDETESTGKSEESKNAHECRVLQADLQPDLINLIRKIGKWEKLADKTTLKVKRLGLTTTHVFEG